MLTKEQKDRLTGPILTGANGEKITFTEAAKIYAKSSKMDTSSTRTNPFEIITPGSLEKPQRPKDETKTAKD